MLKFNSNLLKIKLFYLKFFGKISKNISRINTFEKNEIKKTLIIMPIIDNEYNVAKYCFRDSFSNNSSNLFLINNTFFSSFPYKTNCLGFTYLSRKNKLIFNEHDLDKLIQEPFDLVVDLNSTFFLDMAMIVNKLKANYKVGFKSEYSDMFYNIQFDSKILEIGYKKIDSMLN